MATTIAAIVFWQLVAPKQKTLLSSQNKFHLNHYRRKKTFCLVMKWDREDHIGREV